MWARPWSRELVRSSVSWVGVMWLVGEGFGADGPDGGDPREVGAGVPFVGEVEPLAGAYGLFDVGAGFEG